MINKKNEIIEIYLQQKEILDILDNLKGNLKWGGIRSDEMVIPHPLGLESYANKDGKTFDKKHLQENYPLLHSLVAEDLVKIKHAVDNAVDKKIKNKEPEIKNINSYTKSDIYQNITELNDHICIGGVMIQFNTIDQLSKHLEVANQFKGNLNWEIGRIKDSPGYIILFPCFYIQSESIAIDHYLLAKYPILVDFLEKDRWQLSEEFAKKTGTKLDNRGSMPKKVLFH